MIQDDIQIRVDAYLEKQADWQEHLSALRSILLSTGLTEAIKWGAPAYLLDGKIVASIVGFRNHCALWFHQGALLQDKQARLVNAQDGKTKALRQWRFEAGDTLNKRLVKSYLIEAIDNQRAGKSVSPMKKQLELCKEFVAALKNDSALNQSFGSLTPGKQREYAEHVSTAKQAKTRLSRLEKIRPMVLAGKGLNDKYRNC